MATRVELLVPNLVGVVAQHRLAAAGQRSGHVVLRLVPLAGAQKRRGRVPPHPGVRRPSP